MLYGVFACLFDWPICLFSSAIGVELANLEFVALVTGGFYGVGESVGRNFCEERQILRKEERIFHILPEQDSLVSRL